jgi:predicted dehydrogenase
MQWVSAHSRNLYSREVDDEIHAYTGFRNGLEGFIDCSWSYRGYRTITINISVQGENGNLVCSDDEVSLYLEEPRDEFAAGWTNFQRPDLFQGVEFDLAGSSYTRQASEFLQVINKTEKLKEQTIGSDIQSAYRVQCIMDAIYESSKVRGKSCDIVY